MRNFINEEEKRELQKCPKDGLFDRAFKNWIILSKQDDINEDIILGLKYSGLKNYKKAVKHFDEAARQGENLSFVFSITMLQESMSRKAILEDIWIRLSRYDNLKDLKASLRLATGETKKVFANFWEGQRTICGKYLA